MNNDLISRKYVESIVKAEFVDLQDGTEEWRTYVNDTCENILNKVDNAPTVDFEKLGESLNCQIRATYGSCDDCLLSCPRNELIKLLGLARPQGEWIDYDNTFYKCPDCGYLLEKCCPQCQNRVILPKGGAE